MKISSEDTVPLSQAEARLPELAEEVRAGHEKILTRDGESYIALVDARRLDHYHRLEREHIHLTLLEEAERGLDDVEAGRTLSVEELRAKHGRSGSGSTSWLVHRNRAKHWPRFGRSSGGLDPSPCSGNTSRAIICCSTR